MRWGLIAVLSLFHLQTALALDIPPPPRDYVYDQTGTLRPDTRRRLTELLNTEDQRSGNQVLVAVFPSLEGEDLVDYTNRLFEAWKPGQKGKDNGVLLAVYLQDRKIRIEVGYGLEPILTDALSRRLIETVMVPDFRRGDLNAGIYQGASRLVEIITDPTAAREMRPSGAGRAVKISSGALFLFILILLLFLRKISRIASYSSHGRSTYYRRRGEDALTGFLLGSVLGGGRRGGGGGFGGGGFGGGFGGGGGRSGGGGASGGW